MHVRIPSFIYYYFVHVLQQCCDGAQFLHFTCFLALFTIYIPVGIIGASTVV